VGCKSFASPVAIAFVVAFSFARHSQRSEKPPHFAFALAVGLQLGLERGFQPRVDASREAAYRSAEGWSEARRAKRLNLLPLFAVVFISAFSAQKTHVKPQNHLNHSNKTRSSWHVSSPQFAILNSLY
jgi:hypothetical protein